MMIKYELKAQSLFHIPTVLLNISFHRSLRAHSHVSVTLFITATSIGLRKRRSSGDVSDESWTVKDDFRSSLSTREHEYISPEYPPQCFSSAVSSVWR